MKKLFYVMIIALASSFAMTSCTDEDVKPARIPVTGGQGSLDPL